MNPFNYCALAYADQWLGKDKWFCEILPDHNQPEYARLKTLHEALKFYRVTRNWPGNGIERFKPLLEILDEISDSKPSTTLERTQAVAKVVKKLKPHTEKELFSLATKMLWIWFKQPFIIFDKNAASSLGLNSLSINQAEKYYNKWESAFDNEMSGIEEACRHLPQQRSWLKHGDKITDNELESLSGELFFHQRVFDNFLWSREERGIKNTYINL
jgi:hypothetical protein